MKAPESASDDLALKPRSRTSNSVNDASPRVVLTAANCSLRMGGEAAIPYHIFRILRARGVDVHLVAHDRNKAELEESLQSDRGRLHFVADDVFSKLAWRVGRWLPDRLHRGTLNVAAGLVVQARQRRLILELIAEHGIDVAHQCYPVSPAEPSLCYGLSVPVVIGPMNGGMEYAPGFRDLEGWFERTVVHFGRSLRHIANRLFPGKREADILLIANDRSRQALPRGVRGAILEMAENGIDTSLWGKAGRNALRAEGEVRFVYVGRLVEWKGVDLLLRAWSRLPEGLGARLEVIGDGPLRADLEALSDHLGLSGKVEFSGYLPPEECAERLSRSDALVLPSLIECGGAVVLEAMASGLPVIATGWGGPLDYLDESSGIFIRPGSRVEFIDALAGAIRRLAGSAELRERMGEAARRRVMSYDWDAKVDRLLEVYRRAIASREPTPGHIGRDRRRG